MNTKAAPYKAVYKKQLDHGVITSWPHDSVRHCIRMTFAPPTTLTQVALNWSPDAAEQLAHALLEAAAAARKHHGAES